MGIELRPGQREVEKLIVESVRSGMQRVVLQAYTGFGKTLAVLRAAVSLLSEGLVDVVVYTVRTRNELDPVLRECRRLGLDRVAVLFSARVMCPLAQLREVDPATFWLACSSARLAGKCPYYRRVDELLDRALELAAQAQRHTDVPRLLGDKLGVCPFFTALRLLELSRVVVCTYPYVFKDRIWRSVLRDHVSNRRAMLVVDEAHNLASVGSVFGEEVSSETLERARSELDKLGLGRSRIAKFVEEVLAQRRSRSRSRGWVLVEGVDAPEREDIEELKSVLIDLRLRMGSVEDIVSTPSALPPLLNLLEQLQSNDYHLLYSPEHDHFAALPGSYSVVEQALRRFRAVIAMSGTIYPKLVRKLLAGKGSARYVDVEELGYESLTRRCIACVIATFVTSRYRSRSFETYRAYASIIEALRSVVDEGAVLFVYPSYEFMNRVLSNLRSAEGMIVESRRITTEDVERAARELRRCDIHAVAGGKIVEGIEVVIGGESAIKMVVLMGAPYPVPDDYLSMLRKSAEEMGVDEREFMESLTAIRTMQAVGRAVRSESDRAIAVLADSRFLRPSMLRNLRMSRPCIARSLEQLKRVVSELWKSIT